MDEPTSSQNTGKKRKHEVKPHKKQYYEKCKSDSYKKKAAKRRTKNERKGYIPKKRTTKTTTCYACGEVGHYANRCKTKKIDKIKALKVDDSIKDALMKVIVSSDESRKSWSTDSEDPYSSSSEEEDPVSVPPRIWGSNQVVLPKLFMYASKETYLQ
ncbi:hypothetical protein RND71_039647 [Anisodus tanguticus]|uniref:CCHC-type domain-containing protein n=1 Tax=Anisodus tanguticus TaxID=243964 RepID=A0AAE1QXK0_9SOLA|nr:hypothetical protein RND71_039647 [Anisodus tanguticus]